MIRAIPRRFSFPSASIDNVACRYSGSGNPVSTPRVIGPLPQISVPLALPPAIFQASPLLFPLFSGICSFLLRGSLFRSLGSGDGSFYRIFPTPLFSILARRLPLRPLLKSSMDLQRQPFLPMYELLSYSIPLGVSLVQNVYEALSQIAASFPIAPSLPLAFCLSFCSAFFFFFFFWTLFLRGFRVR